MAAAGTVMTFTSFVDWGKLLPRAKAQLPNGTQANNTFPVNPRDAEEATDKTAIRPFHVNVPEAELTELRRRINATRCHWYAGWCPNPVSFTSDVCVFEYISN
jgi:hypothetical protein